jgi:hypothetical protein
MLESIGTIVIAAILLLLLREVFTWWLKQNKIVEQNKEIIRLLRKVANEPEPVKPGNVKKPADQPVK